MLLEPCASGSRGQQVKAMECTPVCQVLPKRTEEDDAGAGYHCPASQGRSSVGVPCAATGDDDNEMKY